MRVVFYSSMGKYEGDNDVGSCDLDNDAIRVKNRHLRHTGTVHVSKVCVCGVYFEDLKIFNDSVGI